MSFRQGVSSDFDHGGSAPGVPACLAVVRDCVTVSSICWGVLGVEFHERRLVDLFSPGWWYSRETVTVFPRCKIFKMPLLSTSGSMSQSNGCKVSNSKWLLSLDDDVKEHESGMLSWQLTLALALWHESLL